MDKKLHGYKVARTPCVNDVKYIVVNAGSYEGRLVISVLKNRSLITLKIFISGHHTIDMKARI